jgi:single-strand DNA-binding protein
MVIGRLGADPEMRYTPSGVAVTNFRVAVNRRPRRSDDRQEQREETDWFTVVAWERLAETCNQYLKKGSRVYLEGRLQTRSWETQDGQKRYATEIVANDMIMLDTRRDAQSRADEGESGGGMEDIEDIPF